ncbi:MAG TPA: spermidine synthase [Sphingobium sp.]
MQSTLSDVAPDPIILVDVADIPGGGQLQLLRCGDAFSIHFGSDELMGSMVRDSEQALATLVCERLLACDARGDGPAAVLIGGLGMGFTLGAALGALPSTATVVVAELVPKVETWARGPLAHIFGDHLSDQRLSLEIRDVHDVIDDASARFDAIMLDVDNGPDGLIHIPNERLYCNWGLRAAHSALKPHGVLAIWSAYTDAAFVERLEKAGFDVEEVSMQANPGDDDRQNIIWLASRRG